MGKGRAPLFCCVINSENSGTRPVPEFGAFDGQCLLGLDRLGLRTVPMRFLGREGASGRVAYPLHDREWDPCGRAAAHVPGAHVT